MYQYFGLDLKEQKINDSDVPVGLKELLEKHPELWNKITDIKFEDGTTIHQKNGKFHNYEYDNFRNSLPYSYSANDENYHHYSIKFNDLEKENTIAQDEEYFKTSMSFIDGQLQSTKPLDDKYKEIRGIELPSVILKNGKSYVMTMTMMWYNKGKLHSYGKMPSIIKNKPAIYNVNSYKWIIPVTYQLEYHNNGSIDKVFEFYPLNYQNNTREPWRYLYNIFTNIQEFHDKYLQIIENEDVFDITEIQNKHHGLGSNIYSYTKYKNDLKIIKTFNMVTKVKDIHNGYFRCFIEDKNKNIIYCNQEHNLLKIQDNNDDIFNVPDIKYYKNNKLHKEDGPAVIAKIKKCKDTQKELLKEVDFHIKNISKFIHIPFPERNETISELYKLYKEEVENFNKNIDYSDKLYEYYLDDIKYKSLEDIKEKLKKDLLKNTIGIDKKNK
jgi:hypothetical protein